MLLLVNVSDDLGKKISRKTWQLYGNYNQFHRFE